jgi:carboxy-cis,cis-muconate cyclase
VDVYSVTKTNLTHLQSISILPPDSNASNYRGDTLRFYSPTPSSAFPTHVFSSTRGLNSSHRGFISIFSILPTGLLDSNESKIERWQTPSSGGQANAIELRSKAQTSGDEHGSEGVWIVLTDAETKSSGVWILEWNGEGTGGINIVTQWSSEGEVSLEGASHAIWLN